jgi:hypothetical protein
MLEKKVQAMEQSQAAAAAADNLLSQMINDGVIFADDDGTFFIKTENGGLKEYKPNMNQ